MQIVENKTDLLQESRTPLGASGVRDIRSTEVSGHSFSQGTTPPSIGSRLRGKRVGMVTFSPYPADPRPRRAIDALLNEGVSVDLLCVDDRNSSERGILNGLDITRLRVTKRRGGRFAYVYQYAVFILISSAILALRSVRRRYDLVYVHNMPDILVLSALVPKMLGARVILDMHDPMPELMTTIFNRDKDSLSVRLLGRVEKWSFARADRVLTVNLACKRMFGSRSCLPEKIGVVMNSPDENIFPFRAAGSVGCTNRLPNKPFVIMYHGSLVERNGVDLAVDGLAQVRRTVPHAELRIYGNKTPFLERVLDQAHKKGLDGCVHYLGPKRLEDLIPAIEDCDVGVVPNHRSAFAEINTPTRIFEYLAMGKPVIAPSTPGILDYFTEDSLLLIEPGNSADIARQIELVARNYQDAIRVAERGQQIYLQHRWKQERQTLVELVSELLCAGQSSMSTGRTALQQPCASASRRAVNQSPSTSAPSSASSVEPQGDNSAMTAQLSYVLITPAHNEAAFIEKTIKSMINQTVLPLKWVIVDDGSTDETREIVGRYLAQYRWVEMVQMPERRDRSFAGKVIAFNAGYERVKDLRYGIIGNLDADISFEADHFEFLIKKFSENPTLGVAGTVFREDGYSSETDSFEGHKHVSGQCQLFRRQCWDEIGGYIPHRAGGIDWMAVTTARMKGWKTESFRERYFFHYRHLGTAERSVLSSLFSYGEKDYYLGGHPVWELFRVAYRATKQPCIIGGIALGLGYFWAFLRRTPRPVSRDLMAFHRKEQMLKLNAILKSLVRFNRVDNFNVARN